jgi:hypothetical protein
VQEAKRFQNIDKNYMKIVTSALETLNVVNTCVTMRVCLGKGEGVCEGHENRTELHNYCFRR